VQFEYSSLRAADIKNRSLVYPAPGLSLPLRSTDADGLEFLDVNNDGLPDVVQSPNVGRALPEVYYGTLDQTRSFSTHAPLTLSRPGRQIAMNLSQQAFQVADVDGDGFEDVLEFEVGTVHVYGGGRENPPERPYVWKADYTLSGFNADSFVGGAAMFVDLNQDGLTDILTTTAFSGSAGLPNTGQQWTVFINHTTSDWKIGFERVDYSLPLTISQAKFLTDAKQFDIIDINGDTLPDFIWTNGPQGWMCVYENTGAFYQTPAFRTLLFGNASLRDPDCGHGAGQRFSPVHMGEGQCADIGKQGQRQPFQHRHIAAVVEEDLRRDGGHAEQQHVDDAGTADQELGGVRHGAEIGGDVDGVGDEQQRDDDIQKRCRIVPADIAGDAAPGDAADPRGNLLDRDHQRKCQQHGPADAVTELRAGLAVGADAGGIVVGGAGDQSRAEAFEKILKSKRLAALGFRRGLLISWLLVVLRLGLGFPGHRPLASSAHGNVSH